MRNECHIRICVWLLSINLFIKWIYCDICAKICMQTFFYFPNWFITVISFFYIIHMSVYFFCLVFALLFSCYLYFLLTSLWRYSIRINVALWHFTITVQKAPKASAKMISSRKHLTKIENVKINECLKSRTACPTMKSY